MQLKGELNPHDGLLYQSYSIFSETAWGCCWITPWRPGGPVLKIL
jgi:hypothetical protein